MNRKKIKQRRKVLNIRAIAYQAMARYGFHAHFPAEVLAEAERFGRGREKNSTDIQDLRGLLWSSIDNAESQDLDQIEYCERGPQGEIRVMVAIADVDETVAKDSPTDQHAAHNATSVYAGVMAFPMIPERFCYDQTSLKSGENRPAVVMDYSVAADGRVRFNDVYRALVQNKAKLVYEPVGDWLEGLDLVPEAVEKTPGLKEQVLLQDEAAARLKEFRMEKGALELDTIEAKPVMRAGAITDLVVQKKNRARYLIENFMIAANMTMNWFLDKNKVASIDRVLPVPDREQWEKVRRVAERLGEKFPLDPDARVLSQFLINRRRTDPKRFPDLSLSIVKLLGAGEYVCTQVGKMGSGHFGLAIQDYTHSTAPNRRYVDLIIQRLLKSIVTKEKIPYTHDDLSRLASWCTLQSKSAKKVERFMRKVAAAILLSDRVGEVFEGIVTGASIKGTYVRLLSPPVEGRVIRHFERMEIGDGVRVRLIYLDPENAYIDFEGVK